MIKGFHKSSFSGIQHIITFCGIAFYLLYHLEILDYPSIAHYTLEDGDLCLRALYRLDRLVCTFMEIVTQEWIAKQFQSYAKSSLGKFAKKTKLQILSLHIKTADHDRIHSYI